MEDLKLEKDMINEVVSEINTSVVEKPNNEFEETIYEEETSINNINQFQTVIKYGTENEEEAKLRVKQVDQPNTTIIKNKKNDKSINMSKLNDSSNNFKPDKKGKLPTIYKTNIYQEEKPEDLIKKNNKKLSLFNKSGKVILNNEKNNISNNNDLKSDVDARMAIQNSLKAKKERPLYSSSLNTSTTIKNDPNKTAIKQTNTISKNSSEDISKNSNTINTNNCNMVTEKNLNPTSCSSTATNSNTDIKNPDRINTKNSNLKVDSGNNINHNIENILLESSNYDNLCTIISANEETKENIEVIYSIAKEDIDQDSENIDKIGSEQSSSSNLLQESNSSKEIEKYNETVTEEIKMSEKITEEIKMSEKITEEIKMSEKVTEEIKMSEKVTEEIKINENSTEEIKTNDDATEEIKLNDRVTDQINSSNININTDVLIKEKISENTIIEKKESEVITEGGVTEHNFKPDSSTTTYLKNLMLLEEKMFNILESLRNNRQPTDACFEFWNFYFFCAVGENYEPYFKDDISKKIIKESNLLELISIIVCYDASYDIKVMNITINNLKNLIYLVHQNFLIISDFLLTKLAFEPNQVFKHKIQNLILTKLAKRIKKGENFSALKQNSENIITSIRGIFRIYSGKKELIEILSSYIRNLQKINMNNLNELFRTKIYKVPQIKKATKIPLYIRGSFNKEVVEKQVEIPAPYIKDPSLKKYTLVLDLDETLIHFKVDYQDESKGILRIRPGLFEFLNIMKEYYELVIFTAATQDYADPILDAIERDESIFKYKLYRQHVTIRDDEYLKDLSRIGREIENMIIVDNMPQNFNLQKENGIFIKSFYGDDNDDTALIDLAPILIAIVKEFPEDIRDELVKYRDEILNKISSNIGKLND